MKFTKMHGNGNDYIYIDCFEESVRNPVSLAIKLSDRHFGIGADGIVLIMPSEKADCFMDIYNADGSRARMCGNAVRCVAKFIYDSKLKKSVISVDTLSGIKRIRLTFDGEKVVGGTVNMGVPVLSGHRIPSRYGTSIVKNENIKIDNTDYKITCVNMGNPHCIVFTDNTEKLNLEKIGPLFENYEMFPERINTEFVEIIDEKNLKMRVWERGSGETLACGTGACAVGVACMLNGVCRMNDEIKIHTKGGKLTVKWHTNNNVYLTGSAETVFTGQINI